MKIQELIKQISILKNYDVLEEIDKGYSGAKKYLVKANGKSYFLKVQKWATGSDVEGLLQEARVDHAQILETGEVMGDYYLIEEFIEGKDFDECFVELSLAEICQMSKTVGGKYGNFREKFPDRKPTQKEFELVKKIVEKELKVVSEFCARDVFQAENLALFEKMLSFVTRNLDRFKTRNVVFCHNDIKPSNFIVNSENKLVAVDCEDVCYVSFAAAARYGIVTHKVDSIEKYIAFVEGFAKGFFRDNIPKYIYDDLFYFFVLMSMVVVSRSSKYHDAHHILNEFEVLKRCRIGGRALTELID